VKLFCAKINYIYDQKRKKKLPKNPVETILFRCKNFELACDFTAAYAKKRHSNWRFDISDVSDVKVIGEL
jgi:hypothetical protein